MGGPWARPNGRGSPPDGQDGKQTDEAHTGSPDDGRRGRGARCASRLGANTSTIVVAAAATCSAPRSSAARSDRAGAGGCHLRRQLRPAPEPATLTYRRDVHARRPVARCRRPYRLTTSHCWRPSVDQRQPGLRDRARRHHCADRAAVHGRRADVITWADAVQQDRTLGRPTWCSTGS